MDPYENKKFDLLTSAFTVNTFGTFSPYHDSHNF
jgi:hypothetical protein